MPPRQTIVNATLLTPTQRIEPGYLSWDEAGVVTALGSGMRPVGVTVDAAGALLCPGFINLHVHGGGGYDTLDGSVSALQALAGRQAQQGVTAFLPTAAAAAPDHLLAVARAVGNVSPSPAGGARILGLHVEGPFLAAEMAGAQNPAFLRPPSWKEFQAWQEASGGRVRMLTLAPELDPAGDLVRAVAATGVVVAAGHTAASFEQAQAALAAGLSHATHLYNAMPRPDHRRPGVLEALLEDERVSLEIIPDCTRAPHVHPVTLRLLKRMVGVERLCTVTDAIAAENMPDGRYTLAEQPVVKQGDVVFGVSRSRGGALRPAGSVLAMNRGVANLVNIVGFTVLEAVQTATLNPARVLGLDGRVRAMRTGMDADLVLLEPNTLEVLATWVQGELVYSRE